MPPTLSRTSPTSSRPSAGRSGVTASTLTRLSNSTPSWVSAAATAVSWEEAIATADFLSPDSARTSYDFYSLYWQPIYGPKIARLKPAAPLAWDLNGGAGTPADGTNRNHGTRGGNVLYADGHVEWQDAADWEQVDWPSPATAHYNK